MKRRKLLLMGGTLVLGSIAGCGGNGNGNEDSEPTSTEESDSEQTTVTEETGKGTEATGGEGYEVVSSFDTPNTMSDGLAWEGNHLWISDHHDYFYKFDPSTGELVEDISWDHDVSFSTEWGREPGDLAWDGTYLWVILNNTESGYQSGKIYKFDPSTKEFVSSFKAPGESSDGLAWYDSHLWLLDGNGTIYKLNPSTGETVSSIDAPDGGEGLTWYDSHFWIPSGVIRKVDPSNGDVVDSFEPPGGAGLAWGESSLWVLSSTSVTEKDKIYKLSLE